MQFLFRWLIYGNFWIAFGAVGLTYANSMMIYNQVNHKLLIIVFLTTLSGYNLQRIMRGKEQNSFEIKDDWLSKNIISLAIISIVSLFICAYLFIGISLDRLLIFAPFSFIVLFYRWPILGISLRDIPFIKVLLIAFCWGFVTVFLPELFYGNEFLNNWIYILSSFLYILGITIPFDIRDMDLDNQSKKTIPQLFGKPLSCLFATAIILLSGLVFIILKQYSMFLHCLFSALIVLFSYKTRPDYYYSFILDGLLVIIPLYFLF